MLRNLLRETIFMRITLVFIVGILCYELTHQFLSIGMVYIINIVLIGLSICYYIFINKYNITFKIYTGILVYSIIFFFSISLCYFQDNRNNLHYLKIQNQTSHTLKISNSGRQKKNKVVYEAILLHQNKSIGKVMLSIQSSSKPYQLNDVILVKSDLKIIEPQKHPGEFDYKNYLLHKRIHHQFIIDSTESELSKRATSISLLGISYQFRDQLLKILRQHIKDTESYEMAAALLLGERADVDEKVMKSYTDTGTIHIISVSGLHVGIIFIVLQYFFKLVPFIKNEIFKTIAIILLIWMYACLTGLPASVIRSALMISFLSIGKAINIKTNSINHVAASALLILSLDTSYLFDVGFQLSYLAVIGIIYLQKPISDLYSPKTKADQYIWLTFSVSIAAQLFTLPLCMYYFHQFPNYFLIANLLAIPLSSIALYGAIATLLFANVPVLNKICEWAVTYSIKYLNEYLQYIAELPGAISTTEPWNLAEFLFLSIVLFFLILYLKEGIRESVKYVFISLILASVFDIHQNYKHHHPHLWVINHRNTLQYSIETKDSILHLYPEGTKENTVARNHKNWEKIRKKTQKIIPVAAWEYSLEIKEKSHPSKRDPTHYQSSNYQRICL